MAIDAHAAAAGRVIHFDAAGAGPEIVEGVFGIDAAFDGVAFELDVALGMAQRLAHRQHDLVADQVDAGDFLGDRMLDLDALVHFEEIKIALVIHDELDGAGVGVIGLLGDADGGFAHLLAQFLEFVLDQRRGRLLDHFLIAALDGTIPLAQVDDVASVVAQDLELDVVGVLDVFLDVNAGVAEGLLGLGAGGVEAFDQGDVVVGDAHAACRRRRRWL